MRRAHRGLRATGVAWVAFAALVAACSRPASTPAPEAAGPTPPPRDRASLLLVTLDTFRGDFFGAAGDPRARTPHLDRLARTGTQFELGVAGSPITLPSHASLLTGLDGPAHGLLDNGFYRLDDDVPTIATALRERGFRTGAAVAAFPLDARFGLARGFEIYDDEVGQAGGPSGLRMAERGGGEVVDRFLSWLRTIPGDERYFGWAHFYDPHQPHDAPEAFVRAANRDVYRAELAETDAYLGRLVREAVASATPPWIAVFADHGESRDEHLEATHGVFVYDSTLRIPAVIWPAPTSDRRGLVRAMFRTVDFPGTVFALLGFSAAEAPGAGRDAMASAADLSYFESHYARLHFGWSPLRGVRTHEWKLIEAPEPELYDLANDPGEHRNVVDAHPELVERFRREMRPFLERRRRAAAHEPSEEERAALESLGYATTREDDAPAARGALPDPKRMIGLQNWVDAAQGLIASGRPEEALPLLRSAIARDPENKEIQLLTGLAYAASGRHPEAIDAFLRCLSLSPHISDRVPRFELASSYLRLRRPAEARRELEKNLRDDPADASTWYNLGVAFEMENDLVSARRAWETALRSDPTYEMARRELDRIGPSKRD